MEKMTQERWKRIEELYHTAQQCAPEYRSSFLAEACGTDLSLRDKLERMLAEGSQGEKILDRPVGDLLEPLVDPILPEGTPLGPYRVESVLGAGGMGRVYRAVDTRLGRSVAIKTFRGQFSEREARTISSLSHPNICTLHDVGPDFLVMELVEGETLADVIRRGPVPVEEAMRYAGQIADALDAAHEKGIVHSDLKPSNVMVQPNGTVKVLDFGLAKVARVGADAPPKATEAGLILGTPAYMSPEQARGGHVNKPSDVWAFGVVLYEMLTGRNPFEAPTTAEVISAVLTREIALTQVPIQARRLVEHCLERDPNRRLRHVGDFRLWLDDRDKTRAETRSKRSALIWSGVAALILLAALSVPQLRRAIPPLEVTRLEIVPPRDVTLTNAFSVSPDGRRLAFMATTNGSPELWIRSLDAFDARPVPGTKTGGTTANGAPIWSPDSRSIAYWDHRGILVEVPAAGGPTRTIARMWPTAGPGFWTRDRRIVFGSVIGVGISQISLDGPEVTRVTTLAQGETAHDFPAPLPDGEHFLYVRRFENERSGIYVGSLGVLPGDQSLTPLLEGALAAAYVPNLGSDRGRLLFVQGRALMSQPFDPDELRLSGTPVLVADLLAQDAVITSAGGYRTPGFSVSNDGVLAYRVDSQGLSQLTLFDRSGNIVDRPGEPGHPHLHSAFSPDGKVLAAARLGFPGPPESDIWLYELTGSRRSMKWSSDARAEVWPQWSPDGTRLVYAGQPRPEVKFALYEKTLVSSGPGRLLFEPQESVRPTAWSPDGRYILLWVNNGAVGAYDLRTNQSFPLLQNAVFAAFSPDGRWITYLSNRSNRPEVYARPFDPERQADELPEWIVSRGGASWAPFWMGDEIFYRSWDGHVAAVKVAASGGIQNPTFQAGAPERLFKADPAISYWSVSPDGQKFAFPIPTPEANAGYKIVLNWSAGLK